MGPKVSLLANARLPLRRHSVADFSNAPRFTHFRSFLHDGYAVALLERTLKLADTAAKHVSGTADHVKGFAADQTDRDAMESLLNDVVVWDGAPQAVVANAGYAKYSPVVSMSPAVWDRHIDINLSGTFHLCQLAAQHMVAVRQPGVTDSGVVQSCTGTQRPGGRLLRHEGRVAAADQNPGR